MDCHTWRGGAWGCKVFDFPCVEPISCPRTQRKCACNTRETQFSQGQQQCVLFFIVVKMISQKWFFVILICTPLNTGEQGIQKKDRCVTEKGGWRAAESCRATLRRWSWCPGSDVPFAGVPGWAGRRNTADSHLVHEIVCKGTARGQVNTVHQNVANVYC